MSDITWKRIEQTEVQKVGFRTIITKTFELPDGKQYEYQTMNAEDSTCVGVIALTPDNQVITAKQFRAGPEKIMYDVPGGFVEQGEEAATACLRELEEETGYTSTEILFMGVSHKDAYTNGSWLYYLAKNCHPLADKPHGDENEFIEPALLSIPTFLHYAKTGLVSDADAVLMAYDELQSLRGNK